MPSPESERRRYFRIEDDIALSYRVLEVDEMETSLAAIEEEGNNPLTLAATFAKTSRDMLRHFDGVKRDFPELGAYLDGLNSKLDILAQLIVARDSGLPNQPTHAVNMSASGISFNTQEPVDPGSLLELKLMMFPSHIGLYTLGAVVNCVTREPPDDEFPYRLGVDFTYIREVDRDLLVRHVVQKQSAHLRGGQWP